MVTDREALRELEPAAVRAAIGDGSYGGPYAVADEEALRVWNAGVAEVRALARVAAALGVPSSRAEPAALAAGVRTRRDLGVGEDRRGHVEGQPLPEGRRRRPPSPQRPSPPRGPTRGGRRWRAGGRARRWISRRPHSAARRPIRPSTDAAVTWTRTPASTSGTRRSGLACTSTFRSGWASTGTKPWSRSESRTSGSWSGQPWYGVSTSRYRLPPSPNRRSVVGRKLHRPVERDLAAGPDVQRDARRTRARSGARRRGTPSTRRPWASRPARAAWPRSP